MLEAVRLESWEACAGGRLSGIPASLPSSEIKEVFCNESGLF
jgi:hypothetical protein